MTEAQRKRLALIEEGLASGPGTPDTPEDWRELRGIADMPTLAPPNPSLRYITRHSQAKAWRVDVPSRVDEPKARWFYDVDYGGRQQSLLEAQYVRDDCFRDAQLPLHARVKPSRARLESGQQLAISLRNTNRGEAVIGKWQVEVAGQIKTRGVSRSVRAHGLDEAWRQVEEIVRQGILEEAAKLATRYQLRKKRK